jgi:5-methylcytosine-specific restriction protein A
MRSEALFLNGVFESVLEEILQTQSVLPEEILFLQPHSSRPIVNLQLSPPSVDDPMQLFMSISTDLPRVRYVAEIVGWDNKQSLPAAKRAALERILKALQPGEGGLYDLSTAPGGVSLNLLHVRRLARLDQPFSVERLIKVGGGGPLSPNRSTAGGWSYVRLDPADDSSDDPGFAV